jgi:hypothetical protein
MCHSCMIDIGNKFHGFFEVNYETCNAGTSDAMHGGPGSTAYYYLVFRLLASPKMLAAKFYRSVLLYLCQRLQIRNAFDLTPLDWGRIRESFHGCFQGRESNADLWPKQPNLTTYFTMLKHGQLSCAAYLILWHSCQFLFCI